MKVEKVKCDGCEREFAPAEFPNTGFYVFSMSGQFRVCAAGYDQEYDGLHFCMPWCFLGWAERRLRARMRLPLDLLAFGQLRVANVARCEAVFQPLRDWSPADWATALAGEVGEACNLIKKQRRGEPIEQADLACELADAAIYLDLLAARVGIDLGAAVRAKFNEVSFKWGSSIFLK